MRRMFLFVIAMATLPAPLASADNCSSPADCEATADYNVGIAIGGGVIAIISVLIGGPISWDPTSWFRPDPRKGDGTVPPVVPPDHPYVDPYTGTGLTVQDGTRQGGGNIGDVWIREKWRPPAEAIEIINERQREMDKENKYNEDKYRENQKSSEDATRKLREKGDREAQKEREDRQKELDDELKRKRREQLAEQQEQNVKAQEDANSWRGWTNNVKEEFWDKTTKEVDQLPGDLQKLGTDLVRLGGRGVKNVMDGLKDPENWRKAGEDMITRVTDPVKLILGDPDAWDRAVEGVDRAGKIGKAVVDIGGNIIKKAIDDPVGFVKGLTPIEAWEQAMDPNKPLLERIGRTWVATIDTVLTIGGGKLGKDALSRGGKAALGGADEAADLAKAAVKQGKLPPGVDPKKLDELNDAWKNRLGRSDKVVDNYKNAGKNLDDALATGDPKAIERARQAQHDAAIKLQSDKIAIQKLNGGDPANIQRFKDDVGKVYKDTDDKMVNWAKEKGHIGEGAKFDPTQSKPGRQVFVDDKGNKLIIAEPTNVPKPGDPVKAGADRDYTMYTEKPGGKPVDIPSRNVKDAYEERFFEAANGRKPATPQEAQDFAKKMDQAVTDKSHAEAYGAGQRDLDIATAKPGARDASGDLLKGKGFSDSAQVGDAVTYKGDHWFDAKHVDSDEGFFEGARQVRKQFDNQAQGRYDAVKKNIEAWKKEGVVPDNVQVKPPSPRLTEGVKILERVEKMEISPAQAKAELQALGMTPKDVSRGVGDYVDALQRVAPPSVRGRMGGV